MRLLCLFSIVIALAFTGACHNQQDRGRKEAPDEVRLNQNVTTGKPQDPVFKDFDKNWRKFISNSPQLTAQIVGTPVQESRVQEPIISSECIYSPEAQGYVSKATITWNDNQPNTTLFNRIRQQGQTETPMMRFDLGLVHDAFAGNFFSSALSTENGKRFSLPSDSALIKNPEALLLTGPGLFPKLLDYRAEVLEDRNTNRQFVRQTVVLGELSQGLSYNMRV